MGKKRASGSTAAPSRPSKKRKSAEAGKARIKEIVDAEDGEDEIEEFDGVVDDDYDVAEATPQTTITVEEDGDVEEEGQRVVAPGFRVWNTSSEMKAGGELADVSKFNKASEQYMLDLSIRSDVAFVLKPLIITQGAYKGCRVFMLDSPTSGFRILDLPPEIRNLIYSYLVVEDDSIEMSTSKTVAEARRPVRATFPGYTGCHKGLKWDAKTGKWLGQEPSSFTIARASKTILGEVAPMMYGRNRFQFRGLRDLKIFMGKIGSMGQYVRHITVGAERFSPRNFGSVMGSMRDATNLRNISFPHTALQSNEPINRLDLVGMVPESVCRIAEGPLRKLHHFHTKAQDGVNVLDIIKITWERCSVCEPLAPNFATDAECRQHNPPWPFRPRSCRKSAELAQKFEAEIRKGLAKKLAIEE